MPVKILGIDPGSRATGVAILEESDGALVASLCDVIRTDSLEHHPDRLQAIFEQISGIIKEFQPSHCAIETPVYGVDPLAMLKLGRAQAAAILAATNEGLVISEYYPKAVKKAIVGNGNASKQQVAFMLQKLVRLPKKDLPMDATDALGIAFCHHTHLLRTIITRAGENSTEMASSTENKMQLLFQKKYHQNNRVNNWTAFVRNNPDRIRSKDDK
ncbi:MAG: crossover junction endodeoxyribonuclease RuvC [Balneolaceae bacterium]|jgi:crossover junction endodeoxyribonuclease RuvC